VPSPGIRSQIRFGSGLTSVLIVNHEPLSERMTGPTIRNWELAKVLGRRCNVTLAVPGTTDVTGVGFVVVGWRGDLPLDLITGHDVVKVSGYLMDRYGALAQAKHLVVDLYDPFPLENLHMHEGAPLAERHRIAAYDRDVQTSLLRAGDVFLCASERQRDFWTGWLAAAGRLNPYAHEVDAGLERMLLVVPFGVPGDPPRAQPRRFRGVVQGIADDDLVVIWGGGIWNWFDPITLIKAADQTRTSLPRLRVVFPAPASPSPEVLPMRMSEAVRRLSDELGLTGSRVFFGSSWIPYEEHGGVLLEADIGISLHQESVETRFSFRTRILDYLWAGLPIVATAGDSMADMIQAEDLGAVVEAGGVDAVAKALVDLGTDSGRRRGCAQRSQAAATRFQWSVVAQPLVEYCSSPLQAPDRTQIRNEGLARPWDGRLAKPLETRRVIRRAIDVLSKEGPASLAAKGSKYLRRRSSEKPQRG
jgi:glycosyltransferase involved in cell wall biosynthesis